MEGLDELGDAGVRVRGRGHWGPAVGVDRSDLLPHPLAFEDVLPVGLEGFRDSHKAVQGHRQAQAADHPDPAAPDRIPRGLAESRARDSLQDGGLKLLLVRLTYALAG